MVTSTPCEGYAFAECFISETITMSELAMVGIDLGKHTFHLHATRQALFAFVGIHLSNERSNTSKKTGVMSTSTMSISSRPSGMPMVGKLGECEATDLAAYIDNQSATDLPVQQVDSGWKSSLNANVTYRELRVI